MGKIPIDGIIKPLNHGVKIFEKNVVGQVGLETALQNASHMGKGTENATGAPLASSAGQTLWQIAKEAVSRKRGSVGKQGGMPAINLFHPGSAVSPETLHAQVRVF